MARKRSRRREDVPFTWGASCGMWTYAELAGVPFGKLFLDADAIVEAYTKGRPLAEELVGPDIRLGGPTWYGNSYGHINALGSDLIFPEDSEVAHTPIYKSLEQGIAALKKDVDFQTSGLMPRYLKLWDDLKKAFPDEDIRFGSFKAEGPITTAWALRGHDFFADTIEYPDLAREYVRLVTDSIIKYNKLMRRLNGEAEFSEQGVGLCDDVSAMISPGRWPELVMPALEQYYTGQTSGMRNAHIEDLTVNHLRYLDELGLDFYDPSVSRKVTPALIRDHCRVPFTWRLLGIDIPEMSEADVEKWVFDAVTDGASTVHTNVGIKRSTPEDVARVHAFIRAAKEVERLLSEGCPREELRKHGQG